MSGEPKEKEEGPLASDAFTTEDRRKQAEEIEAEIEKKPLVGWLEKGLDSLFEEFKANPSFVNKLPALGIKYSGLRRVRGDGNCFYRSYCYLLFELLVTDRPLFTNVKGKIDSSLGYLLEAGYEQTAVEFFVDEVKDFFGSRFPKNEVELDQFFANKEESMYLVWFMRLLTAGFIKKNWAERFAFFVDESYTDANDYCAREVEPTNKECEQISVISLCEFFGVRTCVEYLDQNPGAEEPTPYFFGGGENDPVRIHLLYRPGHYDILYRRE